MIQLFHVSKTYPGEIVALDDITLQIEKGAFVFIGGPSGAGKSTLLRLLFCEEPSSSGQILVEGTHLGELTRPQIALYRRTLGIVFQDFRLIRYQTVGENVALPLHVLGLPLEVQRRRALVALKEVGLAHKINAFPPALSGGEQQRVAIARAIVNDPHILIADEPTGNLDADLAAEVMKLFVNFHLRGTTVLLATHNEEMIRSLRRRVVRLQRGKIMEGGGHGSDRGGM